MAQWNKKSVSVEVVKELCERYKIDPVSASIFARRQITEGKDLLYFLENDLRFQHCPFLFSEMEDAVDRILAAKEEGEKVLIFGDRDVDGVSSTTILYDCLKEMGLDVHWSIPMGDDTYGLNKKIIDAFAAQNGTLIITVDCGITAREEAAYAAEKYIDPIYKQKTWGYSIPYLLAAIDGRNPTYVDYLIEPIIMRDGAVIKEGTAILKGGCEQ